MERTLTGRYTRESVQGRQGLSAQGRKMTQPTLTIRLNPADTVVVARADILPGTSIPGENVVAKGHIPAGHKISTHQVAEGEPVRRYGQIIEIGRAHV